MKAGSRLKPGQNIDVSTGFDNLSDVLEEVACFVWREHLGEAAQCGHIETPFRGLIDDIQLNDVDTLGSSCFNHYTLSEGSYRR